MLFPRPMSAKRTVRLTLARCIKETGEMYATVLQAIDEDAEGDSDEKRGIKDVRRRLERIRGQFVSLMVKFNDADIGLMFRPGYKVCSSKWSSPRKPASLSTLNTRFEPAFRGAWPKARYDAVFKAQVGLLNALILLGAAYARLQPRWAGRLERTNLMNPAFVEDCLHHFALLEQSLASRTRLPFSISILERLEYHSTKRFNRRHKIHTPEEAVNGGHEADEEREVESEFEQGEEVHALEALGEPLTWEMCHVSHTNRFGADDSQDEQMMVFATGTVAMAYVAMELEELTREVAGLVGQSELVGLERARERYV